jgi:uncharacterized protein
MSQSLTANAINSAFIKVYEYVFLGVLVTMLSALVTVSVPALYHLTQGLLGFVVIIAMIFGLQYWANRAVKLENKNALLRAYGGITALWGLPIGAVISHFTGASVFITLLASSSIFLAMSAYGYFTKRDMTGWGPTLVSAMFALIVVMIVNLFIGSALATMIISGLAVILFAVVTAFEAETVRDTLMEANSEQDLTVLQVSAAFGLYLSFLNIFMNLLNLIGVRVKN